METSPAPALSAMARVTVVAPRMRLDVAVPADVPLGKRVAATGGARVCAIGNRIIVNGKRIAERRSIDPSGRRLPWWSGCRLLQAGEIFLLSPGSSEAFDGRYFGATRASEVIGSGKLLWRR